MNTALMLISLYTPLPNASYVGEVDSGWPPLPVVLPGCRGRTDEGARITIPDESFIEVALDKMGGGAPMVI